jgi:hypothetical protein
MRRIEFPSWPEVLGQAELSERVKHSFEITIRWYLSFCRQARAEVTVQSAREFIAWAVEQKHPQPWQVEEWKEAIRWFFLAAKEQKCQAEADLSPWLPERSKGWPEFGSPEPLSGSIPTRVRSGLGFGSGRTRH